MPTLKTILNDIDALKKHLNSFDPSTEGPESEYWKKKSALGDLMVQAGDEYIAKADPLLVVDPLFAFKHYFDGYICTRRHDLPTKLNISCSAESESSTTPDITETDVEKLFLLGLQSQSGIGAPVNYVAAACYFNMAATRNYAPAQYMLANMHYEGKGVEKNILYAQTLLNKAAEQNYAPAQNYLGYIEDVSKDLAKAAAWFQKSAALGYAQAQYNLGKMYLHGEGVAKDPANAIAWYQKSAEQGCGAAQFVLGHMYRYGKHVVKDSAAAIAWLKKSANDNLAEAQCELGVIYENGEGVTKDLVEACKWFRKSAAQGEPHAQRNLGLMYEHGRGVTEDFTEAFSWYQKSAEQGLATAQYNLGKMYEDGKGENRNYNMAIWWYQKSAAQNNADAQHQLGWLSVMGLGIVKNDFEAVTWFRKAAEQGNSIAQGNLGILYETGGEGVEQDDGEAIAWFRKSIKQGFDAPIKNLNTLYKASRGPTTVNDAKLYRKDFRMGIEALNMLHKCKTDNPASFICAYHLAANDSDRGSFAEIGKLYATNPFELLDAIWNDDLLDEKQRENVLSYLDCYQRTHMPSSHLKELGNHYFERLSLYSTHRARQGEFAMLAISYYEEFAQIKNDAEVADKLVLLRHHFFKDTDLDELCDRYFIKKNLPHPYEKAVNDFKNKINLDHLNALKEYARSNGDKITNSNARAQDVKALLHTSDDNMDAITTGLGKLDIQKNDNLYALLLAQGFWKKPTALPGEVEATLKEASCQHSK